MKRLFAGLAALFSVAALGATLSPVQLLNPAGSTAGQAIVSAGPSSAPAWGAVTATALAPIGANTVIANPTGSSAAPVAHALPSCSTANSALKYTSGTGLSCGTTFALTSGNLSQFASTTSAQLLGVLSDETGTGVAVFSASPTFTGTVNTAALTATGAITPSQTAGIVGTTTNNNANSGSVGEYISSTVLVGSAVSLTTGTAANVTSISLTAGDWDVSGTVAFNPAGTTTTTAQAGAISTTSATIPASPYAGGGFFVAPVSTAGLATNAYATGTTRLSLSATTTVYLVAYAQFATSTETAYGFIGARRVR